MIFNYFYKKNLMKRLLLVSFYLIIAASAFSQTNTQAPTVPEYISKGTIPAFITYKAPDSTVFTNKDVHKGRPTLLMIFSPDCGHCQHVATEITSNIAHFKKAQIYMITWLPYSDMMSFYKNYKIADYPQITIAWDSKYFFLPYFHVQSYPKLIVYDKKGKYVKEFQGNIQIEDVWKALGKK
ncbi:redoxin domain-containing protein [Ginsengibacter hankyongi]|uniref:Redoxin domain-containing protein n=2 Tax=Ginsengibacter hankyongi TaxID=2607284 RepID=A0A5J5IC29_9BACT|nr:redoxin domain-containing protein [Ginsengibacter hankyongi]